MKILKKRLRDNSCQILTMEYSFFEISWKRQNIKDKINESSQTLKRKWFEEVDFLLRKKKKKKRTAIPFRHRVHRLGIAALRYSPRIPAARSSSLGLMRSNQAKASSLETDSQDRAALP